MSGNLPFNPQITYSPANSIILTTEGYIQGSYLDDPTTINQLAVGELAQTVNKPVWGAMALTETVPVADGNQAGNILGVATGNANLTAFSVFNQASNMILTPDSTVQQAVAGNTISYFRVGSNARITVQCDEGLVASLDGNPTSQLVSWDYTRQKLIAYNSSIGALPVQVLSVSTNSLVVVYDPSGHTLRYTNGAVAVIQLMSTVSPVAGSDSSWANTLFIDAVNGKNTSLNPHSPSTPLKNYTAAMALIAENVSANQWRVSNIGAGAISTENFSIPDGANVFLDSTNPGNTIVGTITVGTALGNSYLTATNLTLTNATTGVCINFPYAGGGGLFLSNMDITSTIPVGNTSAIVGAIQFSGGQLGIDENCEISVSRIGSAPGKIGAAIYLTGSGGTYANIRGQYVLAEDSTGNSSISLLYCDCNAAVSYLSTVDIAGLVITYVGANNTTSNPLIWAKDSTLSIKPSGMIIDVQQGNQAGALIFARSDGSEPILINGVTFNNGNIFTTPIPDANVFLGDAVGVSDSIVVTNSVIQTITTGIPDFQSQTAGAGFVNYSNVCNQSAVPQNNVRTPMLLNTTLGVNMNQSATKQPLYTAPTGKRVVITELVIHDASISLTTAVGGFGWNAAATDVFNSMPFLNLTTVNQSMTVVPQAPMMGTPGDVLGIKITTPQGAPATATIDVYGYIVGL